MTKQSKKENIRNLIILGDLYDDLHIPLSEKILCNILKRTFQPIANQVEKIIYIISTASHDPIIQKEVIKCSLAYKEKTLDILVSSVPLVIKINNFTALLTHGEIAISNGAIAYLLNKIMEQSGNPLYIERLLKKKLNLNKNVWLIMGHTHIPGISYTARVANTGNWKKIWFTNKIPYWRTPSFTYILVKENNISLKRI